MAEVILKNVRKVYDKEVVAVDDANIEIKNKEFVVLVGPSGCGKSTTLRMIAGLEEITGGEIYIGGTLVNDIPPKDRDIAMVFQNYALYPHMTVYQNMAFGLKLRKYPKDEIDGRVREAADILGIQELLERKPKALSGGQRQRVAVGRAIVRKPQVFLFDEPLSNLDAKLRVQMRAEISKLHSQLEATMVYVTHDQVEAMTMGHRIAVMEKGDLKQVGTPLELYAKPANVFVARFIGTPPMNMIAASIAAGGDRIEGSGFVLPVGDALAPTAKAYRGRKVTVGIRPEHVTESVADQEGLKARINGEVTVVEPLGHEVVIHAGLGETSVVAKLGPETIPAFGDRIPLAVDCDRLHLFDVETEKRLEKE